MVTGLGGSGSDGERYTGGVHINVKMRRVRGTTATVDKQRVLHNLNVYSLIYLVCKAHAPYYTVICGLSDSTTFLHINP